MEPISDINIDWSLLEKIWNWIKPYIDKAVEFLKKIGIYDNIIELIKKYGEEYGMKFCISQGIPKDFCKSIIDFLLGLIN